MAPKKLEEFALGIFRKGCFFLAIHLINMVHRVNPLFQKGFIGFLTIQYEINHPFFGAFQGFDRVFD